MLAELSAVGIIPISNDSNWNIESDMAYDEGLFTLVKNAHLGSFSSPEVKALKDHLGESSKEWLAYIEARKQPTKIARAARYVAETDPLRMKMDANYDPGTSEWNTALAEWRTARIKIQQELPYPDEV
jgi:hypothetical protein